MFLFDSIFVCFVLLFFYLISRSADLSSTEQMQIGASKKKKKRKEKKGSQKKTHALFYSDSPVCVLFFFVFCFLPHREKCFDYFFVSLSRSEGPFEAFDSVVSLLFLSSRARVCVCYF